MPGSSLRAVTLCTLLFPLLSLALGGCASPTSVAPRPLYLQLGGEAGLAAVTGRVLDRVAQDPLTARSFKGVKLDTLKQSVTAYLCKVADGPCVYEGETMAKAHAQSANTAAEFDRMLQVLREELDTAGVSPAAKNELLRRLAPTRRDIVSAR